MAQGLIVAIVGAESTGKTTLAAALRDALCAEGRAAAFVPEYLREFCDREGRTPRQSEQAHIAAEQSRRVDTAASQHEVVIADTTALMIAVYSDIVFGDRSLYCGAVESHRRSGLTLLTALDLPWLPDGLQRDGAHVREPVDALVRAALQRAGLAYGVVAGTGGDRLVSALDAVRHALNAPSEKDDANAKVKWRWVCERCGDVDCERRLLPLGGT
jgi:nicotinamide riboside kinase